MFRFFGCLIAAVTFAGEEAKGAMKVQGPSKWSRKVVEWDKKDTSPGSGRGRRNSNQMDIYYARASSRDC